MELRPNQPIIVFAETQKAIDKVVGALQNVNILAVPHYPNISLYARAKTLMTLQNGKLPVLVGSTLVSRGLDTSNVSHVI